MDAAAWGLAVAAGVAAGSATGLVPGLHTNTLAALLLALAPGAGEWGAHALVAAASAHAVVSCLPSTYVGVPGEESALSVLPAHRMLHEGRGREAVRIAAGASVAATCAAILVLLPYKWLMREPGRVFDALDAAVPWILAAVPLLLVAQEWRRGGRGLAAAAACTLLAGALGWLAMDLRMAALVPLPATPLLPLLSGLFGAAGLVHSLATDGVRPEQDPAARPPSWRARLGIADASLRGVAAAGWTAALPGLTSAVGASVALSGTRSRDPRLPLACMNAVGAAHQVFAIAILWLTLRARTGTAIAVQDLSPVQVWAAGRPPDELTLFLATVAAAAGLGHWATLRIDAQAAPWLMRLDGRRLSLAALAVLVAVVLLLSGPAGLLLLGAATCIGLLPIAWGVRRVHLTGALVLPALLFRLG